MTSLTYKKSMKEYAANAYLEQSEKSRFLHENALMLNEAIRVD